mmetsp:Transcript_18846/g.32187  ORF Transcript_18846/g.32187 Transcript_18846/m.32187 type:complete len:122 (+) Transcript_18846:121-486(+)|eukprot:CAMPEP_0119109126 /NCGR_PEP_ID=MMETSP1180-20130426/17327_1 /TAXON_ID=3052 ORGANISM="Chlamydomonas cf sp, Strain CCMP681" /NCGR_SAMPLE_ID=MMETSP1180 /ASSEMBLY_ACC=CAM_ASM_000741 /LENGTH=121 /DNA_ID=CAMNT_0007094839 /DNA_START=121 /DNA_END=486 /DNA_ORIENTATION=-
MAKRVDVTKEDQTDINAFNKFNSKMRELEMNVKAKKRILEDLEDAGNELMLSDEEQVRYVIGECFVSMEKEQAEERLQAMSDTLTQDVKDLGAQMAGVQDSIKALKAKLYLKFGNSIQLEE